MFYNFFFTTNFYVETVSNEYTLMLTSDTRQTDKHTTWLDVNQQLLYVINLMGKIANATEHNSSKNI